MMHSLLSERYGKGEEVTSARFLYHLTDYHGYAYTIDQDSLKTLRSHYVSTTDNPKMNSVGGRDHYDFKFVLDGEAVLAKYKANRYVDSYQEIDVGGRRRTKAYKEYEVGIETTAIEPLSTFLVGTILRFNLFSERGLQWLLYRPTEFKGLFDAKRSAAPHAIKMLYRQLFEWRKPVWVGEQGKLLSRQEMSFIHDAHDIIERGGSFKTGFEQLADKYPIVSHDDEPVVGVDVRRMFLAPKLVKALNGYYRDRPRGKVRVDDVRKLLNHIFDVIGIGNNAVAIIMHEIDKSGLLHPSTEPVTWGGIISKALKGDVEDVISTIEWYGRNTARNREWYDQDGDEGYQAKASHYGTSFGRMGDR